MFNTTGSFGLNPVIMDSKESDKRSTSFCKTFADELEKIFQKTSGAFPGCKTKTHLQFTNLMISMMALEGPATISNAIRALGLSGEGHTSKYRTLNHDKLNTRFLEKCAIIEAIQRTPETDPIMLFMDGMHNPKCGRLIPYTGYVHNPLADKKLTRMSYPVIWGHRYLNIAMMINGAPGEASRMVPVMSELIPKPPKELKSVEEMTAAEYDALVEFEIKDELAAQGKGHRTRKAFLACLEKMCNIQYRALLAVNWLISIIRSIRPNARIILVGDGGFTTNTILKPGVLPKNCVYIGAIRKDAKLFEIATTKTGKITYGDEIRQKPYEMYKDDKPFKVCQNIISGKITDRQYKTFDRMVLWRKGSQTTPVNIVVAKGLQYQSSRIATVRRREVAYLVCTSSELTPAEICQIYHYRWGIEEQHKELKSTMGFGEAQVFGINSTVKLTTAYVVANTLKQLAFLKTADTFHGYIPDLRASWNRNRTNHVSGIAIKAMLREGLLLNGFFAKSWQSAKQPSRNPWAFRILMSLLQTA